MIKLRLDVDYPYPSRLKSLLFTILKSKAGKDYLKNSKIIAKMINDSREEVRAYWFFTPQTTPDAELLRLLHLSKHEVALHVANNAYSEWEHLEKTTGRKVKYYTIHGTARLLARLMWRRKIWEAKAPIPTSFPLKSFYDFPTLALDWLCYYNSKEQAVRIAENRISKNEILHVHPEWLFQHGSFLNRRGPYYETLKTILNVDKEIEGLVIREKGFAKIASYAGTAEYEHNRTPSEALLEKLAERGVDIFTFIERRWCCSIPNPPEQWMKTEDNIATLRVTTYSDWWKNIGKKTRNMIRKAEKNCVTTQVVEPDEKLAKGIWKIYNETPIRQGRTFPHYGAQLRDVTASVLSSQGSTLIGAFLQNELVGFIQIVYGDDVAIISQILSLQKFWDKAVNNALVAKAIEVCAAKQIQWIMYGRMGNHPSLDSFKESNGFSKFPLTRYYVPLTKKGRITAKLGLHREAKETLPQSIKGLLIPVFNWLSRIKVNIKRKQKANTV
jgi:hypothetical protein